MDGRSKITVYPFFLYIENYLVQTKIGEKNEHME